MNETTIRKVVADIQRQWNSYGSKDNKPEKAEPMAVTLKILILSLRPFGLTNKAISIYVKPNQRCSLCEEQSNRIIQWPKNTTADHEVIGREWCLIDIDPTRASGVNATDEEKEYAKEVSNKVYKFLRDNGSTPCLCG